MRQQWHHLPWRRWLTRRRARLAALTLLLALGTSAALAQSGGLELGWWTIDGGGAVASSSGSLTLSGTIGQPDAAPSATSGGLSLSGGFWYPDTVTAAPVRHVYLPLVAQ